ncbi:hypothetical protein IV102_07995 [bacterium]|nr:hypothetical protein [bacterium]
MNALPQYQSLLHGSKSAAQVSQKARDIKSWVESTDNSRSDSNKTDDIVDHTQFGMGLQVQADISNLGPNRFYTNSQAFELNRMLTRADGTKVATHVQVFESLVTGYEVTQWPDGSSKGYQFGGCPSDAGPVSTTLLDDSTAASNWAKVYVSTLHT